MTTEQSAGACLDEATILELVQGVLSTDAMRAAEGHIARCPECRQLVSVLARSSLVGLTPAFAASVPKTGTAPLASSAKYAAARVSPSDPPGPARARMPSNPPSLPPLRAGDVIAGKYRVDHVLGIGGMGVVIAATHVQLGQQVALKFLLPAACEEPGAVARFLREGRAAVRIQSEHVARVTDVETFGGTDAVPAGTPYMVMEFLRGTDLAQVLKSRGPLPVTDAVDYVLQACEAIAEAHTLGIVHRDLKPANLFLTSRADGTPLVKVLDFGISKASSGTLGAFTTGELVMGSPRYMSPEQMRSTRDVDAKTDIWALGILLHELVTGHPAFEADTMAGLCALIATGAPTPLRKTWPNAPEALEIAILRCLEKDPRRRMATVADLAEALAPVAPPRSRVSIDRIVRVMNGIGSAATVLDARAHVALPSSTLPLQATAPQSVGAATGGGFGRTSGTRAKAVPAGVTWGVLGVLLAIGVVGVSLSIKPIRTPAVASSQPTAQTVPSTSSAPIAADVAPSSGPIPPAPPPPEAPAPQADTRPTSRPSLSPTIAVSPRLAPAAAAPKKTTPTAPLAPTAAPTAAPVATSDPEGDLHRRGLLDRK